MIRLACPVCGQMLAIPDEFAGRTGACTHCKGRITVPEAERSVSLPFGLTRDLSLATHVPPAYIQAMLQRRGAAVNQKDGTILVPVPAGRSIFGSPEGEGEAIEHPQFAASLPDYYIGVTCVTNAQYYRFVVEAGHRPPDHADRYDPVWEGGRYPEELAAHPVVCVGWHDAVAYCEWAGLRLPGELEWEKGARGSDGRRYPWGGDWDPSRCRHWTGDLGTRGVWSHPDGCSPYGCFNMQGNVFEWCADWHDPDANRRYATGDLAPPGSGSARVVRGGSWRVGGADNFRCACRFGRLGPEHRESIYGFRCARHGGPTPPTPPTTESRSAESRTAASPNPPDRNPAVESSAFADSLRCSYCGQPNVAPEWPARGDVTAFYCQTRERSEEAPGVHRVGVHCPHCNNDWFVVWDEDPR